MARASLTVVGVAAAALAVATLRALTFAVPDLSSKESTQQRAGAVALRTLGTLRTGCAPAFPLVQAVQPRGALSEHPPPAGAFGAACRAAVAAAFCAFVSSAASRSAAQRRTSGMTRRIIPSWGYKKQKVMRRLEPFGPIPAWSKKPLIKRKLKRPWMIRPPKKLSAYGRQLIEKQRIRFHYNIKDYQLRKYMGFGLRKGNEFPVDTMLQKLESRIDNVVWRLGLAPSMGSARHFVKGGHIQWRTGSMTEWRTINVPGLCLKVGDTFRVRDKETSQRSAKRAHEEEPNVLIPDHLEWDWEEMTGKYLGICDHTQFGLTVDPQQIALWYSGQGRRGAKQPRRRHIRYHPGTQWVITKRYDGGRIRPTPENLLNMKRGVGLFQRGRQRPPCLWGRMYPLNDPYEVPRKTKKNEF